ncbi:MAG: hypothetical protein AB8H79_10605 [Myxococcota bacterium]
MTSRSNYRSVSALFLTSALVLTACGRDVQPAEVKLLNVGLNPNEIGPAPTPYGGIVELNHIDLAGGALPLRALGLSSFNEAGPDLVGMAPPYQTVFGLSYLFDTRLRGATNLTLVMPSAPAAPGACYTQIAPEGPFDSGFNTVDVGDAITFSDAETGKDVAALNRVPRDYPPEASRLSVYYQVLQGYSPTAKTNYRPVEGSDDPLDMEVVEYRPANFPFGRPMKMSWPGGFTSFDKPVGSIPQSFQPDGALITLPQSLDAVKMDWTGPLYKYSIQDRQFVSGGESETVSTCWEFTSRLEWGGGPPADVADCLNEVGYPRDQFVYRAFGGQMYTGPWATEDGVTFSWEPDESDDTIVLAVKFLAPLDLTQPDFNYRSAPIDPDNFDLGFRPAQVCETEEDGVDYRLDEANYSPDGSTSAALQGNPSQVLAQVVCNIPKQDGNFTLAQSTIADAYDYAKSKGAGGALFMMGRTQSVEVATPDVKDPYDNRHEVSPILLSTKAIKIGRFFWDEDTSADGGAQ